MKPTVARMVHYTNLGDRDGKYPPEVQAAVITKVVDAFTSASAQEATDAGLGDPANEHRYIVSLHVFYPTGQFDLPNVPFTTDPAASEGARGKWGWPARE